jgi:hypothetical protein
MPKRRPFETFESQIGRIMKIRRRGAGASRVDERPVEGGNLTALFARPQPDRVWAKPTRGNAAMPRPRSVMLVSTRVVRRFIVLLS